jgi:hypothetical protein
MSRRFRYALEPARAVALARERHAGRLHALAVAQAAESARACAAAQGALTPAPAAAFSVASGALALAEEAGARACERCVQTRRAVLAARALRERFDAHRAMRHAEFVRVRAAADERQMHAASAGAPGAPPGAFESARA